MIQDSVTLRRVLVVGMLLGFHLFEPTPANRAAGKFGKRQEVSILRLSLSFGNGRRIIVLMRDRLGVASQNYQ